MTILEKINASAKIYYNRPGIQPPTEVILGEAEYRELIPVLPKEKIRTDCGETLDIPDFNRIWVSAFSNPLKVVVVGASGIGFK